MKEKLLIIPILALLLLSSGFALLSYDGEQTLNNFTSYAHISSFEIDEKNNLIYAISYTPASPTGYFRGEIINKTSMTVLTTHSFSGSLSSHSLVKEGEELKIFTTYHNNYYKKNLDFSTISSVGICSSYRQATYSKHHNKILFTINNGLAYYNEDSNLCVTIFDDFSETTGLNHQTRAILTINKYTLIFSYNATSNYYVMYDENFNQITPPTETPNGEYITSPYYVESEDKIYYVVGNNNKFYTLDVGLIPTNPYTYINGMYYSDKQCIDTGSVIGGVSKKYLLCNSSTMQKFTNTLVAYCDGTQYETICSGECLTNTQTINGSVYVTGYCDESDCINECLTIGSSKSVGLTSYRICGQYDTDICLEYSGTLTCPSGEVYDSSSPTYCTPYVYDNTTPLYLNNEWYVSINTESELLTTEKIYKTGFINTYLQLTEGITANFNPFKKNIYYWNYKSMQEANAIKTVNKVGVIDFGTFYRNSVGGDGFVSFDCKSNYNNIVNSEDDTTINTTYTLTDSLTGYVNTVSFAITPTTNTSTVFNYFISKISPSIEETTTFTINNTRLLIENDGVILLNQTFSSDIKQIYVYSDIDFNNGFLGHKYIILESGGQENVFYTNPKSFIGTPTPTSNQISFSTNEQITINGYSVTYSNTMREGFENVAMGTFFGSCLLDKNQNQILRVYYNDVNIPSYIDFKDIFLDVNIGVGVIDKETDKTLLGRFDTDLNIKQKYLLAIFTSIAFFILTLFMSNTFELNSSASGIIGVVAGVCAFLFFVIIGWLPMYVAIVSFIIAGGVGAVFIRRQVVGM